LIIERCWRRCGRKEGRKEGSRKRESRKEGRKEGKKERRKEENLGLAHCDGFPSRLEPFLKVVRLEDVDDADKINLRDVLIVFVRRHETSDFSRKDRRRMTATERQC